MLLHPGEGFDYNGRHLTYPDIRLVYWAGGNPFHHHQDLGRLRRAFARPETLVVHETAWTATARHADIVLPCTMTLERDDIGGASNDPLLVAMHRVAEPFGEARDDYEIFAALAERLGAAERFTEGRSSAEWLRHLYGRTAGGAGGRRPSRPGFRRVLAARRAANCRPRRMTAGCCGRSGRTPTAHPLPTPSGRIEIFSATIAGFGYADCPGHPVWLPPREVPDARHSLRLVANQPATRLHSQLDFGGYSAAEQASRPGGRAACTRAMRRRGGSRTATSSGCSTAGARAWPRRVLPRMSRPAWCSFPTGAWYDPEDLDAEVPLCVHGNPNVLTLDVGTSRLAQGCTGQLCVVEVERFRGNLPPIMAFTSPALRAGESLPRT